MSTYLPKLDAPPNECAAEYDACNVTADCCTDGPLLRCIAGHCATTILL